MRRFVVAVLVGLCCVGAVAQAGQGDRAVAATAAESMYRVVEVVGVFVETHNMYTYRDVGWYSGRLRIDEVAEGEKLKVGQILRVKYNVPPGARPPYEGDQVRASLHEQPIMDAQSELWLLAGAPEVLGRGDFVRPGERADVDLGSSEARILVKMLAPMFPQCHKETARLLTEFAKREPERVRIQIFNIGGPSGRQEVRRERINCATVLVNNRYEFTLIEPDGERKVALHHKPNEPNSPYQSKDVIAVIEQELKRLYP
jgi:hypothetical protein